MPTYFSLMRIPTRLHCGDFSYKPMTVYVFHYPGILDIFLLHWISWRDWCASEYIYSQDFLYSQSWSLGCSLKGMNFLIPQWCSKQAFCIIPAFSPPMEIHFLKLVKIWAYLFQTFLPEYFVPLQSIFTGIPTLVIFRWALWESEVSLSSTFQADRLMQKRN